MNWPLFIGICFAVLSAAGLALACMSIDEPAKTSPARPPSGLLSPGRGGVPR